MGFYWLLAYEMISWTDDRNLAMIYLCVITVIEEEYYRSVMDVQQYPLDCINGASASQLIYT